jgi:phosphoribosylglycinamide formyltransferase-1
VEIRGKKMKLACLASGSGTNLQAIIDHIESGVLPARIVAVIANEPGAQALARAERHGLPAYLIDHRKHENRSDFERAVAEVIDRQAADLVCLCGFMRILTPDFVARYPNRILNIHPALLPRFGGRGFYGHKVHQAVLASGEKESGCTVHFVDAQVDHGPIILQRRVPVLPGDTLDSLAQRVLAEEHIAYSQAIAMIAEGKVPGVEIGSPGR